MSSQPRHLIGEVMEVLPAEGGGAPRIIVQYATADEEPRWQPGHAVALVPLVDLHGSAVPPIVAENQRLREQLAKAAEKTSRRRQHAKEQGGAPPYTEPRPRRRDTI